jgi:ABC-type lipoprotein export system ATPase subunit
MTDLLIEIKNLTKVYRIHKNHVSILKNINFTLNKKDIICIIGPSGSGKSTFLNIIGLLDSDFNGNYKFLNNNINKLSDNQKNIIRNKSIGFVHQFFHLIPELNVLENISLPNLIHQNNKQKAIKISKDLINTFGLKDRLYSKPLNLSGGEQQRVAIARAIINQPDIIIADEMTGNLDEKNSDLIFNFFLDMVKSNNQSLIYVTHNKNYTKKANQVFEISDGNLIRIK